MFEDVLELRVKQATADLHREFDMLKSGLASSHDRGFVLRTHALSLVEMVREEQTAADLPPVVRELLARLVRRLEVHLELYQKLEDEAAKAAV